MATTSLFSKGILVILCVVAFLASEGNAQLSPSFYDNTCPQLRSIVRRTMIQAVNNRPRIGASILRLHFHDCFVNGCDGSVLLDDTPSFQGEKNALPNQNSLLGFGVIDTIKANVEAACSRTVSCADILTLAARDGTVLLGGPSWPVSLGRRDSTTASLSAANTNLPPPFADLGTLIRMFGDKGLNAQDMTALSGAHTVGLARCSTFRARIYNDTNINPNFAARRQSTCPATSGSGDDNLAPIDTQSPFVFGNAYYRNLMSQRGLFHSDQELFNGGSQDQLVRQYSNFPSAFARDFANAMIKMGNISPLTGSQGQIRNNCRFVN
ncbi:hypothetical protein V2J09_002683 [Rumex salicifolius]